jgi:hypothetical protein
MKPTDRVQAHTAENVNEWIREETRQRVVSAAEDSPPQLSEHIEALDREWDIERWLEMNASALALTGVVLGLLWNRKFFAIPCLVLPFLFQHAVQGWCPPIPILRRKGVRTRNEIDEEKFALKAMRGDFAQIDSPASPPSLARAQQAWEAATT